MYKINVKINEFIFYSCKNYKLTRYINIIKNDRNNATQANTHTHIYIDEITIIERVSLQLCNIPPIRSGFMNEQTPCGRPRVKSVKTSMRKNDIR